VVGTRGRTKYKNLLIRRTVSSIITFAHCIILVVRQSIFIFGIIQLYLKNLLLRLKKRNRGRGRGRYYNIVSSMKSSIICVNYQHLLSHRPCLIQKITTRPLTNLIMILLTYSILKLLYFATKLVKMYNIQSKVLFFSLFS
jgi:hypothetical protein